MTRELTCIICPRGCSLQIALEGKEILSITGNGCPRGIQYAEAECCNPQRTVTSTVRCEDGRVIAVKTDRPIPKEQMFACMERLNAYVAKLPVSIGDVLIPDVFGSNIVAAENVQ